MLKRKNKTRVSKKTIILIIAGLIVVLAITAQVCFNLFVLKELQRHSAFTTRTLIVDAIQSLDELRKSPEGGRRIPEARVILPPESENIVNLRYTYSEPTDDMPASIEITTKGLTQMAIGLNGTTVEEVFSQVPQAQACHRGFSIFFGETRVGEYLGDTLAFVSKKQLADGREVQLWREKNCGKENDRNSNSAHNYEIMNQLEQHLLQMDSY